jgi:hypothetical protein
MASGGQCSLPHARRPSYAYPPHRFCRRRPLPPRPHRLRKGDFVLLGCRGDEAVVDGSHGGGGARGLHGEPGGIELLGLEGSSQ